MTRPRSSSHWGKCRGFCRREAFSYTAKRYPFLSRARDCWAHNFGLVMTHTGLNSPLLIIIYVYRMEVEAGTISYWDIPSLGMARHQSPTHNHFYTCNKHGYTAWLYTTWVHGMVTWLHGHKAWLPVCCNLGSVVPLSSLSWGRRGRILGARQLWILGFRCVSFASNVSDFFILQIRY